MLKGNPHISLWHGKRRLPVRQVAVTDREAQQMYGFPIRPIRMTTGSKAQITVLWPSWCQSPVFAPVILHIALPGGAGTLTTNTGTSDHRQVVSPPCYRNPHRGSFIDVWPFVPYPVPPPR
jgi:hypothetical protein